MKAAQFIQVARLWKLSGTKELNCAILSYANGQFRVQKQVVQL